jgi:hypothetical protein
MSEMDERKERQRLEKLYAGMEEEELEKVSTEWLALTRTAKDALRAEMLKRGMSVEEIDMLEKEGARGPEPGPVVVRRYRDLPEAWVMQAMIDSAGIESVLLDENVVRLDWLWSNAIGGVKLQVRARDAEDALGLLSAEKLKEFQVPELGLYRLPLCPNCGSIDVAFDSLDRRISYLLFFISLPIPVKVRGWRCYSCGHLWKEMSEGESQ